MITMKRPCRTRSRWLDCRRSGTEYRPRVGAHQTDRRDSLLIMLDIIGQNRNNGEPGRVGAVDCGGARFPLDWFDLPPAPPWRLLSHPSSGGLLLALVPQWPCQKPQLHSADEVPGHADNAAFHFSLPHCPPCRNIGRILLPAVSDRMTFPGPMTIVVRFSSLAGKRRQCRRHRGHPDLLAKTSTNDNAQGHCRRCEIQKSAAKTKSTRAVWRSSLTRCPSAMGISLHYVLDQLGFEPPKTIGCHIVVARSKALSPGGRRPNSRSPLLHIPSNVGGGFGQEQNPSLL
jgi:hypothetical protein